MAKQSIGVTVAYYTTYPIHYSLRQEFLQQPRCQPSSGTLDSVVIDLGVPAKKVQVQTDNGIMLNTILMPKFTLSQRRFVFWLVPKRAYLQTQIALDTLAGLFYRYIFTVLVPFDLKGALRAYTGTDSASTAQLVRHSSIAYVMVLTCFH
ncbi:hypothetical protein ES703_118933 [subsurface metagenome]